MSRKTVYAVIIIGILSIISILIIQIFWIKKTIQAQKDAVIIIERQDSLNIRQFEESVRVALKNAVEEIGTFHTDSSDVYGAVKQQSSNYFSVDINEDLHPYYLEQVLKRNFYANNITQNFQYGIYDCYNDSIVYGNLIRFSGDSLYAPANDSMVGITSPELQWKKDGHYFTVYFPDLQSHPIDTVKDDQSPWTYLTIIVGVILLFFGFSIFVIIKQKKISEVRTDFINNMTHELKTPISTIGLSSEMLLKSDFSKDTERLKKYVNIIYKENKRLEQQVERVLNIAKLNKNNLILHLEEINLHLIINEITADFQINRVLSEQEITLNLNAQNAIIKADPVHITNILYNLLDNAFKYSNDTPKVEITTENKDGGIIIEVKDNGIGMTKEHSKQIFNQFYRVPTGDIHNVKGFGLGLYYVKIMIEKHQGKINVQSQINRGSKFSIWLPN